jgi:hypothetical protein
MARIVLLIVVVAVLGLGLGYYRGWYSFSQNESALGNKVDVRLTIDRDRVKSDTSRHDTDGK